MKVLLFDQSMIGAATTLIKENNMYDYHMYEFVCFHHGYGLGNKFYLSVNLIFYTGNKFYLSVNLMFYTGNKFYLSVNLMFLYWK